MNTSKISNFYTPAQRFAARVLFIVWLLISNSLQSALAGGINLPNALKATFLGILGLTSSRYEREIPVRRFIEDNICSLPGPGSRSLLKKTPEEIIQRVIDTMVSNGDESWNRAQVTKKVKFRVDRQNLQDELDDSGQNIEKIVDKIMEQLQANQGGPNFSLISPPPVVPPPPSPPPSEAVTPMPSPPTAEAVTPMPSPPSLEAVTPMPSPPTAEAVTPPPSSPTVPSTLSSPSPKNVKPSPVNTPSRGSITADDAITGEPSSVLPSPPSPSEIYRNVSNYILIPEDIGYICINNQRYGCQESNPKRCVNLKETIENKTQAVTSSMDADKITFVFYLSTYDIPSLAFLESCIPPPPKKASYVFQLSNTTLCQEQTKPYGNYDDQICENLDITEKVLCCDEVLMKCHERSKNDHDSDLVQSKCKKAKQSV